MYVGTCVSVCVRMCIKARHLGGSAFSNVDKLVVPKQALGGIPLDFGIVMEDKPSELSRCA